MTGSSSRIPTAEQSRRMTADTLIQRIPTAEQSHRTTKYPTQQLKPLEVARTRANKAASGPDSLFLPAPSDTATGSRRDPISVSSSDDLQPIAIRASKRSHAHSGSVSSVTTKSPPSKRAVHNTSTISVDRNRLRDERGEPGYDIAQFLVFTQHVQYVKTDGSAYITDYQGSGSLLTDPQILTHLSVGDGTELFGEGNLEVGVQRFPKEHFCNEFCKWQGFNLASPESVILDTDGT